MKHYCCWNRVGRIRRSRHPAIGAAEIMPDGANAYPAYATPSTEATCQAPLPDGANAYPAYEPDPAEGYNGAVCASTTANATILTIRRTEAIGVNTCTGLATPINTGPTVTPSALETRSRL